MCLAIAKPANRIIPVDHLRNGFDANPHGAGFAFSYGGQVHIRKGFFKFEDFLKAWEPAAEMSALVHFRWATHGVQNEFNCHPWPVLNRFALVHNGILGIESTDEMSDTGHYVKLILEPALHKGFTPDDPALRYLIETSIGRSNKFALLHPDGSHTIYNESAGETLDGVWYSNSGYKERESYCSAGFGSSRSFGQWWKSHWEDDEDERDPSPAKGLPAKADADLLSEEEWRAARDAAFPNDPETGYEFCEECGAETSWEDLEEADDLLVCPSCKAAHEFINSKRDTKKGARK